MTDEELKTIEEIDPQDYFNNLKAKTQEVTDESLKNLYEISTGLLKKAYSLGQIRVMKKLIFTLEVLEKEHKLYEMGLRTFVYRDDVEYYMDKVSDKAVKIIGLKDYPREIPDEIADVVMKLKEANIFDEYHVVFTDYTGQVEREVAAERKRKDPILFGIFSKREPNNRVLHDRFYYIADWEDEYCDLTLGKMVSEMAKKGREIQNSVYLENVDVQSVRDYITSLEEKESSFRLSRKKKSFFDKIKFWS